MTNQTVDGYDITSVKWSQRPSGNLHPAFYSTGSPDIKMTASMIGQYPDALRIDQANGTDDLADFVDCESGCYSAEAVPGRIKSMRVAFNAKRRANQRWPGVYCARNNRPFSVSDVANALTLANLANVPLIIADWNNNHSQAQAEVANSVPGLNNPFPVVGRQYQNVGPYDLDVWSVPWLQKTAGQIMPTYPFNQNGWRWCHKCQGLFWGPGQVNSHCPAGGAHDGGESSVYEVTATAG